MAEKKLMRLAVLQHEDGGMECWVQFPGDRLPDDKRQIKVKNFALHLEESYAPVIYALASLNKAIPGFLESGAVREVLNELATFAFEKGRELGE